MDKAAKSAAPAVSPQESEREQPWAEILRVVRGTEARLDRIEASRGKLMRAMKGTRMVDIGFEFNIRVMEVFISEPTRVLQNVDKVHLQAFLDIWPSYVAAVDKADIAGTWIAAREKQGGHVPADATPGAK